MSKTQTLSAIVAMDEGRVIGCQGQLPWHLPEDLSHFKTLTTGHAVVMGRKTWESLPDKFRPLPNRTNIVVSRTPDRLGVPSGVHTASSPEAALDIARAHCADDMKLWIIGGAELYRRMLPFCQELHVTHVEGHHDGDATFPVFEDEFEECSREKGDACCFVVYRRKGCENQQTVR